jgi:signal transduction histidine kinase
MTDLLPRTEHGNDWRQGATAPRRSKSNLQALHLWAAILPAAVVTLVAAATVAFVLTAGSSTSSATRIILIIAAAVVALVLIAAASAAAAITRRVDGQLGELRADSSRSLADLRTLTERTQRGEQFALGPEPVLPDDAEPFALLAGELERERWAAREAVIQTATVTPSPGTDQRVEVFVNLARRMQSLVHREIQLLDDLEGQVEDPILLKGLFTVDHLATRMRRQSESLAVLGGAVSRRQWNRSVTMHEVLRAAVAEVEQYSRVKVVPPVEGTLPGNAVADVIHLVAELIENATKFSAPQTQALLRAQHVTAGLAIEVEDRGLGMVPADQQRMNGLLTDPGQVNISELLRDGRIGLFVVSTLARRHGIRVQLQANIYGGTQAVVILPKSLIEFSPRDHGQRAGNTDNGGGQHAGGQHAAAQHAAAQHAAAQQGSTQQGSTQQGSTQQGAGQRGGGQHAGPQHAAPRVPAVAQSMRLDPARLDPPLDVPPAPPASPPATAPAPALAGVPGTAPIPAPVPAPVPGGAGAPQYRSAATNGQAPAAPPAQPMSASGSIPPAGLDSSPAARSYGSESHGSESYASPHADLGERPMLPRRQSQSHIAPQLRDAPADRREASSIAEMPGLMAAFQSGVSRAEQEAGQDEGPGRTGWPGGTGWPGRTDSAR